MEIEGWNVISVNPGVGQETSIFTTHFTGLMM